MICDLRDCHYYCHIGQSIITHGKSILLLICNSSSSRNSSRKLGLIDCIPQDPHYYCCCIDTHSVPISPDSAVIIARQNNSQQQHNKQEQHLSLLINPFHITKSHLCCFLFICQQRFLILSRSMYRWNSLLHQLIIQATTYGQRSRPNKRTSIKRSKKGANNYTYNCRLCVMLITMIITLTIRMKTIYCSVQSSTVSAFTLSPTKRKITTRNAFPFLQPQSKQKTHFATRKIGWRQNNNILPVTEELRGPLHLRHQYSLGMTVHRSVLRRKFPTVTSTLMFSTSGDSNVETNLDVSSDNNAIAATTSPTQSNIRQPLKLAFESQLLDAKRYYDTVVQLYEQNLKSSLTIDQLQQRIKDYETEQLQDNFWSDTNQQRASIVHTQLSESTRLLQRLQLWESLHGDAQAALEILMEHGTNNNGSNNAGSSSPRMSDEERELILAELLDSIKALEKDCMSAELEYLLSGPYDDCPARIVITAGAGGIEAMDWVADLTRMYTRYCERQNGYTVQRIDWSDSFSGYKSMELLVTGPKAFGYLQGEKGSHRLVRISPYNAMGKRQTTFAGVDVTPDLPPALLGTLADIQIPETELEVTTMRSPGKGGQHVNKVSSGVRMKHIPSGISVRCTEERSQLANRNIALHRLKTQLLIIAQEQRVKEIRDIRGDIVEASWGTQIRSYVLQPYRQVKDTRTGWETTQTQAFLDGSELLDECIGTYLRYKAENERRDSDDAALCN